MVVTDKDKLLLNFHQLTNIMVLNVYVRNFDQELVTYRTKNLKKIDETGFIERLKVASQPRSVRWNDSIQLVQQQTEEKKTEEKHTIA